MRKQKVGPKIKPGQMWRKKKERGRPAPQEIKVVLITKGGDKPKGKDFLRPHIQHHFKPKTLWHYYELCGTEEKNTCFTNLPPDASMKA